ncbi:MAG: hypothetical protein GX640_22725 [Fibrobacter sp.]|nr:hypothetical protein [Fibrobacter sp.]
MVALQEQGCHNINLVTATHFLPWIIRALYEGTKMGLTIPVVYNCGGYEVPETIAILGGIVDIFLPDMKYGTNKTAFLYSHADDYVEINRAAVREMFRQVGPLRTDDNGIAYRGLCIRHLVLPNDQSSSYEICSYLKSVFDPQDITISLMAQYKPVYKACDFALINHPVSEEIYESVKESFLSAGFEGFYQEVRDLDNNFLINFKKRKEEPLTGKS